MTLATVHERGGYAVGRGVQGAVQGLADEPCRRRFDIDAVQCSLGADAFLLQGNELLDHAGIGTDFPHGVQVQFEMAAIACAGAVIRFFPSTISLIKRAACGSAGGSQGSWTQVSSRCSRLVSDMKSQTAKTWLSIKRRNRSIDVISEKPGVR